jgi:ferritin-like metal-binding protein YciE
MRIRNLNDLFIEQLKDMHSSGSQAEQAYTRWKEKAETDDLRQMLDEGVRRARTHMERIEKISKQLDMKPTGHKCEGTAGLIREGNEFLDEVEGGAVKDAGIIAMAQRIMHYGIAGFGCTRTYALHLEHVDAAEMLQRSLDEEAEADERMTELAERTLNTEAMES